LNEAVAEEEANQRMPLNEDDLYLPALTIVNLRLLQRSLKQFKGEVPISVFPDVIQNLFTGLERTVNTLNFIRNEAVEIAVDTQKEAGEIVKSLIGATNEEKMAAIGVAKKVNELSAFIAFAETDIDSIRQEDSPREISNRRQEEAITLFAENIYRNIGRNIGATAYIPEDLDVMRRNSRRGRNLDIRPNKHYDLEEGEVYEGLDEDLEEGEVYEGRRGGKVTRKHRRRHRKNKTKKVRRVRRTNKRRRRIIKRRKSHKKH